MPRPPELASQHRARGRERCHTWQGFSISGSCFPRPFPSRWQHGDTVLTPSRGDPAKPHQPHLFIAPLTAIPPAHPLWWGTNCHGKGSQPHAAPGCTPGWGALLWAARGGREPGEGSWQELSSCRRTKACNQRPMIYTLNYTYCTRSPNVWKCHTALTIVPNFCPPINVQFPSKDKAVHYFWLTNSAQGTLIFPHALGGQMLHRDCLRAMTEQAHF